MRAQRIAALALNLGLLFCSALARAQCSPITSVPTVISTSGAYCLTANLSTSTIHATAITVNASGIVLDFQGFRLMWTGSTSSLNPGISVQAGNSNVTIRNGLISGFDVGIDSSGAGTIVEDMRMNNNILGIAVRFGGEGTIIRRNSIRLGNGIKVDGSNADAANNGSIRILDNDIFGPDIVSGAPGFNGLHIQSKNAFVVGNRLGRLYSGIWFDPLTQASGKYRDNLTTNVTVPYVGGTDAGNNN